MPKPFTRRRLLVGAAPVAAAVPMARLAWGSDGTAALTHQGHQHHGALGHAAMIGSAVPAPGKPGALDALTYPPLALPHRPGRLRRYDVAAVDRDIEVAQGVTFSAWTYNGTVAGPVIRATEDDTLLVTFFNGGSHPHTIHFHGIHPSDMDGVFEVVDPGRSFTYQFPARPYGMHLYHCHANPLTKHVHNGRCGGFMIGAPEPRKPAQGLVFLHNAAAT